MKTKGESYNQTAVQDGECEQQNFEQKLKISCERRGKLGNKTLENLNQTW